MPHRSVRLQPRAHFRKIHRPMALMDLHRVPSAKRDVRPAFAGKMDKIPLAAGAASRPRIFRSDFGAFVAPHVKRKQGAAHCSFAPTSILIASVAEIDAARFTAEFRIPAVSQVSKAPRG